MEDTAYKELKEMHETERKEWERQRKEYEKDRKNWEKERSKFHSSQLISKDELKNVSELRVKLETELENYKKNNYVGIALNFLSIILTSIGASMIASSLSSSLGWAFVAIGAILFVFGSYLSTHAI